MAKRSTSRPDSQTMTDDGTLAVSHLRVSTKEQAERGGRDEGFSLPAQRESNQRKAEPERGHYRGVHRTRRVGTSTDRPALQRLLAYVKTHPVAYCIVHKIDRLARNRLDDAMIHYELRHAAVTLVSAPRTSTRPRRGCWSTASCPRSPSSTP